MKNNITSKQACTLAHQIRRETGCSLAEAFKAAYSGNTTVNTKTSYTADEFNQIFSDKAAELLRKGYIIELGAMSGSQGEIGKITFKKDGNYYVLVMENSCGHLFEGKYCDHYVIRFGKYTEEVNVRPLSTTSTLWLDKFNTMWSIELVKVTDNYFVTVEEAEAMNKKYLSRFQANKKDIIDRKYYKYVLPAVRAQKGCKSLRESNIVKVERIFNNNYITRKVTGRYYKITTDKIDKAGRPVVIEIRLPYNK